jgi:thiamine kinase-like enzyme
VKELNISSLNLYDIVTNRSFKVVLQNESLFFRIGRENAEQVGINRETEISHYRLAESLGLAPPLLAYQIENGILISKYIEATPPSEERVRQSDFLEKVMFALKRLHTYLPSSPSTATTIFLKAAALAAQLAKLGIESDMQPWLERMRGFEEGHYDGIAVSLCHGDLFRGNFLEQPEGNLLIVDWEYSYVGPVIDDLGKLCAANWLSDGEIRFVIESYWGAAEPERVQRVMENIYVQQLNLYLLCQVRAYYEPRAVSSYLALANRVREHLNQLGPQLA